LNVIAVAVPIRDANRIVIGILVLQVRLDAFFSWIKAIEMDPEVFVYVVDPQGQIAFHPRYASQEELVDFSAVPVVRQVLQGKRGVEIALNPIEGIEHISAYAPIGTFGWGVVAAQPVSSAFAAKNHQLTRLLLAYALILLLCVSVMYLISRMVLQHRHAAQDRRVKVELERRVAERTAQLQAANAELQTEIAERKRAQEELDRYFTIARDLFCIAGFDGHFKRLNPAWEKTLGWTITELVARPLLEFVHPDDREATLAAVAQQAEGREIISFENRYLCKDGSYKWLRWSSVPVTEQQLMFAVAYDLTERKQAEEQIKELNASLEQRAAQLEAANKELESFSYSVSHDLRAPLRAIDGYSQMLEEDYAAKLDDEGRRLLGVIRDSSRKMGTLIDDLLGFSRLGRKPIAAAEVNMNELVVEVLRDLGAVNGGKLPQITLEKLPPAWGDRALLRQVWVNLLSNGVKFSRDAPNPNVKVGVDRGGAEDIYWVKDSGVGFDMQYYNKLFRVFQRLHSADEFPGTGVGLAIVQRVVTRHGGRVWAEGKINAGATFYFALPRGEPNGRDAAS
jgi:PAS domain S-box-containing protein